MRLKILALVMLAAAIVPSVANAQHHKSKVLIAYFSYSGNTRTMANQIKAETGADVFEIVPQAAYPAEMNAVIKQGCQEIKDNFRPALKGMLPNLSKYDVIFVGSPCWCGTIAPPVFTFLSKENFAGKTIIPFMTHGGSRMGQSVADIKKMCPKARVLDGLPILGRDVNDAASEVHNWLLELKIIK